MVLVLEPDVVMVLVHDSSWNIIVALNLFHTHPFLVYIGYI